MRHFTPLSLALLLTACDGTGLDTLTDNTLKADTSDPAQAQALDSNIPAQPAAPATVTHRTRACVEESSDPLNVMRWRCRGDAGAVCVCALNISLL